jgi:hypothetical protein
MKTIIVFLSVLIFSITSFGQGFHYLTSSRIHTILFGRFEVRMKIIKGGGVCNAMCPIRDSGSPSDGGDWAEIDIEILGDRTDLIESVAHMQNNQTFNQRQWCWQVSQYNAGLDEDYHTYTIEWGPYHCSWGLDGVIFRHAVEEGDMVHDITYNLSEPGEIQRDTVYETNWLAFWRDRPMRFAFDVWRTSGGWGGEWEESNNTKAMIFSWFKYYEYVGNGAGDFDSDYLLKDYDDFLESGYTAEWARIYSKNILRDGKCAGPVGSDWDGIIPPDPGDTGASNPTPFPASLGTEYRFRNLSSNQPAFGDNMKKTVLFSSSAEVSYALKKPGFVSIEMFDAAGRLVAVLKNEWSDAGTYTVPFKPSYSGIYLLAIKTSENRITRFVSYLSGR